ncbi:MAG: HU family DNA-binding protein [Magnetococcales bacterium]|nr:HU family DNA-binding protein [Magnetococcales bacterium]
MNLTELTKAVAKQTGITDGDTEKTLLAFINTVKEELIKGESVNLLELGKLKVITQQAATQTHPKTGEIIYFPEQKDVQFKMAKPLQKAILAKGEHDEPLNFEESIQEATNVDIDNDVNREQSNDNSEDDKIFSMRISIPKGAIVVHGLDADDKPFQVSGVDISMNGISFITPGKPVQCITQISYPHHNVTLNVKRAGIHHQNNKEIIAVISVFENDTEDWMRWIELMTRLDEMVVVNKGPI